eukprot:757408-Hanusia_phi.AAC.4
MTGRQGVVVNQSQARIYFRKAAEQGHARAQVNLALYLSGKGKGGPPNLTEAVYWFEKAAQQVRMGGGWERNLVLKCRAAGRRKGAEDAGGDES